MMLVKNHIHLSTLHQHRKIMIIIYVNYFGNELGEKRTRWTDSTGLY